MNYIDYLTATPEDEWHLAWRRVPSSQFSKMGSLEGRAVCALKMVYHGAACFIKPPVYIIVGSFFIIIDKLCRATGLISHMSYGQPGYAIILTGLVSPFGQIIQLFKAAMGILYPGCYFKENEFDVYFSELVDVAQEVNCDQTFIDLLKQGPEIVANKLKLGSSLVYYEALFQRDLNIIAEKLKDPSLSKEDKFAFLDMLAPIPDVEETGMHACPPGFGRLLEQMCAYLDVPKEEEKILPFFALEFKKELLLQIAMKEDVLKKYAVNSEQLDKDSPINEAHFFNILAASIGDRINLPQNLIEQGAQDLYSLLWSMSESEKQELTDLFVSLQTEEALASFFLGQLNSQPDGRPGLKKFRDAIIRKLIENLPEKEITDAQEEVKKRFGIGDALADDPAFTVKLRYFLYPDANPSDEKASDLNEEGIKAYAALLPENPFDELSN